MDERALVERCRRGEPGAWEEIQARHAPAMRRASAAYLGNAAEAEEVCQKVLVTLSADGGKALGSFRGTCRLETWLLAVALHEAAHHRQAEARRHARERQPEPPEIPTPLQALCRAEDAERLHAAMGELLPRDRLVLRLLYWDGLRHADAARTLRVSASSITTLLRRAQARLGEALKTGKGL